MAKNKNNQAFWNSRINKKGSALFEKIGSSIDIDKRLYKEDILGSIAHVEMLFKQKIISFKVKNKIIYGLQKFLNYSNFDLLEVYLMMASLLYMAHTKLPKNLVKVNFH